MTIKGKTLTLTLDQWSAKSGLKRSTIANRIARAWTPRQAVGLDHRPQGITGPKTNASRQTGYMAAKNQQRRETAKRTPSALNYFRRLP